MSLPVSDLDLNLECPVCYHRILPPVFQCRHGHLVCEKCLPRLQKCPVCQEVLSQRNRIRNLELEKVIKRMSHPCPFEEEGCQAWVPYDRIDDHKFDCSFGTFNFCSILGLNNDCKKEVSQANFCSHVELEHKLEIHYPNDKFGKRHRGTVGLMFKDGGANHKRSFFYGWIKHEGRQVCWILTFSVAQEQGIWQCFILRGRDFSRQCWFELKIYDRDEISRIVWQGPCLSLQSSEKELKTSFTTPLCLLEELTDDLGNLHVSWKLTIASEE